MNRYEQGTNISPRYEYGRLDEEGKFQLVDMKDPLQVAQGRYIKITKGIPAKLNTTTPRGAKQLAKKLIKQAKLKEQYGCKVS